MSETPFRGLYTVIYQVPDVAEAREWYATAFGVRPYFDEPFYVGFNIGGYELGLHPGSTEGGGGVVAYWGVDDADAAVVYFLDPGEHNPGRALVGQFELIDPRIPYC